MAKAKSSKALKINMQGVEKEIRKGGKGVRVPEGDYLVKVIDHEIHKTDDSKGIRWRCQIVEPKKYKGKTLRGYTSLKPEALWSLRNLIYAALGKNMAGKAFTFDPAKVYGKVVGAAVSDNEFETSAGKTRITSQIDTFFPKKEYGKAEDEDEEDEDETEDDEEEEDEEDEDSDDDEDLEDVDVEDL